LAGYSLTGFELAARLMEVGVVPEKAGVQTLTLFIHIGAPDELPTRVADVIIEILAGTRRRSFDRSNLLANPLRGLDAEPGMEPSAAMSRALVDGESIPLDEAPGRICLELVEAYPPGIPIGVPGFRLTEQAVAYLTAVARAGGRVVCLERERVLVLRRDTEEVG
jgi:lysine decarboxylase